MAHVLPQVLIGPDILPGPRDHKCPCGATASSKILASLKSGMPKPLNQPQIGERRSQTPAFLPRSLQGHTSRTLDAVQHLSVQPRATDVLHVGHS